MLRLLFPFCLSLPLLFQALGCALQNSGCGRLYLVKRRGKEASPRHICCWAGVIYCEMLWRLFNNMRRCFYCRRYYRREHEDFARCNCPRLVQVEQRLFELVQTKSNRRTTWQRAWSTFKQTVWLDRESKRGGVQGAQLIFIGFKAINLSSPGSWTNTNMITGREKTKAG